MNCKKDINLNERIDYRVNSNIEVFFEFPDTVKVGKKNIANLVFYNRTFDTIIEPRVKGYVQFRVFLFSEFYPENTKTNNLRVFSDYRFIKNDSMFIFKASKIVSKNVVVIE